MSQTCRSVTFATDEVKGVLGGLGGALGGHLVPREPSGGWLDLEARMEEMNGARHLRLMWRADSNKIKGPAKCSSRALIDCHCYQLTTRCASQCANRAAADVVPSGRARHRFLFHQANFKFKAVKCSVM